MGAAGADGEGAPAQGGEQVGHGLEGADDAGAGGGGETEAAAGDGEDEGPRDFRRGRGLVQPKEIRGDGDGGLAGGNTGGDAVVLRNARVNGYLAVPSSTTAPFAPRDTTSTSGIVTATAAPTMPATKMDPPASRGVPLFPHSIV